MTAAKQAELAPCLLNALDGKPQSHQDRSDITIKLNVSILNLNFIQLVTVADACHGRGQVRRIYLF